MNVINFKLLESIQNFVNSLDFSQYFSVQELAQADSSSHFFKDLLLWFFPIPEKGISINLFNILAYAFWITLGLTVLAFFASNPIMLIVCGTLTGLFTLAHLYSGKLSEIEFELFKPKY